MKAFYDRMLPNTANKLIKKMGSKVKPVNIPMASDASTNLSFPITDKMKATAGQGMVLFQNGPRNLLPSSRLISAIVSRLKAISLIPV